MKARKCKAVENGLHKFYNLAHDTNDLLSRQKDSDWYDVETLGEMRVSYTYRVGKIIF